MTDLYTSVKSADIFRRGAEVIRQGSAELCAGVQTLRVYGLTAGSQTDTVRLYAGSGVSCSNLRFASQYTDGREPAEITELKERIGALKRQIEVRDIQKELWKTNGDFSARSAQPAAEVREYIEKLAERLEALDSDIAAAQKEIEELQDRLDKAERSASVPVLLADIEAAAARPCVFELKYFERYASWRPVYEIRSEGEGPLSMIMKANITQNTDEDWPSVHLDLYSGNPVSSGSVPRLSPVYLDIRQPAPVRMTKSMAAGMNMAAFAAEDGGVPEPTMYMEEALEELITEEAQISSDEVSTKYALPGARQVSSGGEGTSADIRTYEIPCNYRVVAVPRSDENAYLVAAVKPEDIPVHSAVDPAIYYKGVYAGKVRLDPDFTEEETEITLGKEERIHVSRTEVLRKTSTALLKGRQTVEYVYETKISNASGKDVEVVLKDQVPVSQNKDIDVDITELSGMELIKDTGMLSAAVPAAAGKTQTIKLSYKVSYPKDKILEERC